MTAHKFLSKTGAERRSGRRPPAGSTAEALQGREAGEAERLLLNIFYELCLRVTAVTTFLQFYHFALICKLVCNFRLDLLNFFKFCAWNTLATPTS